MPEVWNYDPAPWRTVYKYRENFARDASSTTTWLELRDWNDRPAFRKGMLGYATWAPAEGGNPRNKFLTRVIPKSNPYTGFGGTKKQFLQRLDLDLFYPTLPDAAHVYPDPAAENWLYVDGPVQYQATWAPVPYDVLDDDAAGCGTGYTGASGETPPESRRFVRVIRRYMPEARKTPSAGFECYDPAYSPGPPEVGFKPFVIQEVGFVPTFQIEITAELIGWPFDAYPDTGITACVGCVNEEVLVLRGKSYGPGTLLYKGPAKEVEPYDDAAGFSSIDVPHLFGWRPQGWNFHRLNDGRWKPLVVKGTVPAAYGGTGSSALTPMFAAADFQKLFQPG